MLNLKTMTLPKTPNTYLLAPEGYCQNAQPNGAAPVYAGKTPAQLKVEFVRAIENESRLSVLEDEEFCMELRQRTPLVGWPDYISVCFLEADEGGSTLAIYSRSKYGRKDFGVNRKRIERWLDLLGNKS
ncbi:DUF1499 domain-containing protein [Hirschia baltica]|uniref:DUF1499 domain-containing protein n=1 Tax=Hirschia baltica (strain ATCC 49814 / DSM 5838 / IFAM 1418) TaxID=582402 RepID=C6XL88_HIRBI|nr:DUF1499 domain-containing protein [Hirschia baltica]ACT59687.1 conserved hypothetical protein [Hirschia baltica ATCC 49814]